MDSVISESRPKRLLDIGSMPSTGSIKVVDGHDLGRGARYGTLSHVRGKAKTLKLLTHNLHELQQGIDVSEPPASYKEALIVVEQFGLRYLWIDSLCIIQDSVSDWLHEASKMGDVYHHSYVNIGLAGAARNSESSFRSRSEATIPPAYAKATWAGEPPKPFVIVREDF